MATQVPLRSSKRQRLTDAASEKAALELAEKGKVGPKASSLIVQFQSGQDGSALGPSISLPADTSRKQLEMIVNRLRKDLKLAAGRRADEDDDDDDLPYSFHVMLQEAKPDLKEENVAPLQQQRMPIASSLQDDVLNATAAKKLGLSTEDVLTVIFEPQAVFRVRPVTRCSSTLGGHSSYPLLRLFSHWFLTSHRLGRQYSATVGSRQRAAATLPHGSSELGALCRVGRKREEIRDGR